MRSLPNGGERGERESSKATGWLKKARHKYTLQVSTGELEGMERGRKRDELLRGIPISARKRDPGERSRQLE